VAKILNRIERALEEAVEGTSRRLFRSRLQPVLLAKAAGRAMQEDVVIGPDGPEAPNRYRILVHPSDFREFAPYRVSLQERLVDYLERAATERGLKPVSAWSVEIEEDSSVRARSVRVLASMEDVRERPSDISGDGGAVAVAGASVPRSLDDTGSDSATALLVCEDGREIEIGPGIMALGRALENDVVISDTRVSRFHAEIQRNGERTVLRDLQSTNGTAVAGRRISEHPLAGDEQFSLGGYTITFRAAPG